MSEFEEWAAGGGLSVVKFPMSNIYKDADTRVSSAAWNFRQSEIDQLKAEKVEIENLLNTWRSFVQEQEFCTKPHKETNRISAMATALEKALRGGHE